MRVFARLLARASLIRLSIFFLAWCWLSLVVLDTLLEPIGGPSYADLGDPTVIRQLAFDPSYLRGVAEPPVQSDDTVRIAWVSASPVLYGKLAKPNDDMPPGFVQEPIARQLSQQLGRPVSVEAYAMPNSRVVEIFLTTYHALQSRPTAIVVSLSLWDFSNRSISMPRFDNFRVALLAKHPSAVFERRSMWAYLHAGDLAWSGLTALMPVLQNRLELKRHIESWYAHINPIAARTAGNREDAEAVALAQKAALATQQQRDGIFQYSWFPADMGDPDADAVGNGRIIGALLEMLHQSGIPAVVYASPTELAQSPEARGLEAALAQYQARYASSPTLRVEPRLLNRFLEDLDFKDTNHLKHPSASMTAYLATMLRSVIPHGQPQGKENPQ